LEKEKLELHNQDARLRQDVARKEGGPVPVKHLIGSSPEKEKLLQEPLRWSRGERGKISRIS